ncbi:MAG TPA: hypothetical protein VNK04_17205 [Gemmataceae bacterium]|nr:hypothetical protein [Gemmataceae bacterium]
MRRFLAVGAILALASAARAQLIEAEITYYSRGKKTHDTVRGTIIEESPGLIAYRLSGRTEKVPAPDVVEVVYLPASALARQDIRRAQRYEDEIDRAPDAASRRKAVQQAIDSYQQLLPQLGESNFARRHIAFKAAQLTARLAEDDPEQREAAIGALTKFLKENGTGWQVGPASKLLAQLQLEKGDLAAALKTYHDLAQKPDLARETRHEYELLAVRALLRRDRYDEAQKLLKAIQDRLLPEDAAIRARVNIYLAGCQGATGNLAEAEKSLKAVLEGEADGAIKALACNTLADCYRKANRAEDAFWRYLMVDILYNQDPEEHARALYELARLFEELRKDPVRAQECRERLLREKQFAGVDYRRWALRGGK